MVMLPENNPDKIFHMFTIWFYLTLILAVFQWLSRWFNWKKVYIFTKPGTLISLIVWSLQISSWQGGMIWFGLALIFSLAGDILLMLPARYFLSGLAAFLTAHVLYIIGLNPGFPRFNLPILLTALVLLIFDFFWIRKFYSRLKKKAYSRLFRVPTVIYSLVISLMLFSAVITLFRPEWAHPADFLIASGAVLFTCSDTILAYNRFFYELKKGNFWIMLTYHLGQILLISGAILQFS